MTSLTPQTSRHVMVEHHQFLDPPHGGFVAIYNSQSALVDIQFSHSGPLYLTRVLHRLSSVRRRTKHLAFRATVDQNLTMDLEQLGCHRLSTGYDMVHSER